MNGNRSRRESASAGRRSVASPVPSSLYPASPAGPGVSPPNYEEQIRGRRTAAEPREIPTPMNALDRLREQSLAVTGGRSANMFPQYNRSSEFAREREIQEKTNQKRPIAIVPRKTKANDAAGPPINMNLTQLTSDANGQLDTSEWMHDWWGHACGCGEESDENPRRRR